MLGYCPTCHDVMSSTALDFHRSQHDPLGRPFKCNRGCVKTYFATFDDRQHHLLLMHGIEEIDDVKSEIVDIKSLVNQSDVKPPMSVIRDPTTLTTTKLMIKSDGTDTKPSSTHPSSAPVSCRICDRVINITNMHFHMRLHNKTGRPYECVLGCPSTYFMTERSLKTHYYRTHESHAEQSTKCTVCGLVMTRNMQKHMRTHSSTGRSFQCTDGCVQTFFANHSTMMTHRCRVHKIYAKPKPATTVPSVACTVCQKMVRKKNLVKHMKRHNPDGQPHECTHGCRSFFFATTESLNRHVGIMHPDIKSLNWHLKKEHAIAPAVSDVAVDACTVCNRFLNKSHMVQHMRLHDNRRPFPCESGCSTTYFKSRNDLVKHMRLVHKVHLSKCTVCYRTIKGETERHMRLHDSTDRPFKCSSGCIETFFESETRLLEHIRRVHGVKEKAQNQLASCTVCGTELLTRNMKLHMVMHENEKKMVDNEDTVVKQMQLPEVAASELPEVASTVTTTAEQQSDNKAECKISSVSRPVGKKIRSKTKVPVKRRSIIGTPTVQMQLKKEPSSPLPAKQARRDPRPPSPPVYDQPDSQGSANNQLKPPTVPVHKEDDVTLNSDSTKVALVTPRSQTTSKSVDNCTHQDSSSVHSQETSIKRRRQSHHHSETCPTTPNNVDDTNDNADVADRRVVDEKLTTVEQPDDKVGNKHQSHPPSLPVTNHVSDVAQKCRSSPPKLTNIEERQVQFEEDDSDSDTSVIVTAVMATA